METTKTPTTPNSTLKHDKFSGFGKVLRIPHGYALHLTVQTHEQVERFIVGAMAMDRLFQKKPVCGINRARPDEENPIKVQIKRDQVIFEIYGDEIHTLSYERLLAVMKGKTNVIFLKSDHPMYNSPKIEDELSSLIRSPTLWDDLFEVESC